MMTFPKKFYSWFLMVGLTVFNHEIKLHVFLTFKIISAFIFFSLTIFLLLVL